MIKRLIINLTSYCNECCPFCCVEASSNGRNFMSVQTLRKILDDYNEDIEVQMTGGEPTLHPDFYAMVQVALQYPNILKLIIDTNGTNMEDVAFTLRQISQEGCARVLMKVSVNYYLLKQHPDHLIRLKKLILNNFETTTFGIALSVAYRIPESLDGVILKTIKSTPFKDVLQIKHPIAFEGRARKTKLSNTCLEKMRVVRALPIGYATDGTCFGTDLEGRNRYELEYRSGI